MSSSKTNDICEPKYRIMRNTMNVFRLLNSPVYWIGLQNIRIEKIARVCLCIVSKLATAREAASCARGRST